MTVHAQAASDLLTAETLMNATARTAFETVVTAGLATGYYPTLHTSETINAVREIIQAAFTHPNVNLAEDRVAMWVDRVTPLGYLHDHDGPVLPAQGDAIRLRRLGDDIDALACAARRRTEQVEASRQANEALAAGDEWAAFEHMYAADLAAFEAWLLTRSALANDMYLADTELLWTLGVAAIEQISEFPTRFVPAVTMVRSRLAWTVGPCATSLVSAFTPLIRETVTEEPVVGDDSMAEETVNPVPAYDLT